MEFLLATIAVFYAVAFLIRRKMDWGEIIASTLFALLFQQTVDIFLDLKYDLYGYFNPGVDSAYFIVQYGLFPPSNYIFLNLFPYGKSKWIKIAYFAVWEIFLVVYEQLSILDGYFYHHGWKLSWSAAMNPVLLLILLGNLHAYRKIRNK